MSNRKMSDKLSKQLIAVYLIFVCATSVSMAEDIDIYIQDIDRYIQSNVLLILDTSGSMSANDVETDELDSDGRVIKETRIDALKGAVSDVLAIVENVNIGLMQFNYLSHPNLVDSGRFREGGSVVLFPITDIDTNINTIPGEENNGDIDVRARIRDLVGDVRILAGNLTGTPIVQNLYEAARYWRGNKVEFGRAFPFSHLGSYCTKDASGRLDCPNLTLQNDPNNPYLSYGITLESTGGTCEYITNPTIPLALPATRFDLLQGRTDFEQCSRSKLNVPTGEQLRYNSPITHECQKNYQILISDGEASSTFCSNAWGAFCPPNLATMDDFRRGCVQRRKITYYIGENKDNVAERDVRTQERCGTDIAKFLHTQDQITTTGHDGLQTVDTSTIGFTLDDDTGAAQYLRALALAGGGKYYSANNAADLKDAIDNATGGDASSEIGAAAAPTIPDNLSSGNSVIYLTPFVPSAQRSWDGNIKKYYFCSDPHDNPAPANNGTCEQGDLLDKDGNSIVEQVGNKKQFRSNARSLWSTADDGNEATKGGVGARIQDEGYEDQVVYSNQAHTSDLIRLDSGNWDDTATEKIRRKICLASETEEKCKERMLWILGRTRQFKENKETGEIEATGEAAGTRWAVSDSIHSAPAVITYNEGDPSLDRVVVGSNDGSLRFINAKTGDQEWKFYPRSMLDNLQEHYKSDTINLAAGEGKLYGIDLTPVVRIIDRNDNGIVNPRRGDAAHVIFGMRRGGNSLFALDVTPARSLSSSNNDEDSIKPKWLWRIKGKNGQFAQLGQTWSKPVLATIQLLDVDDNDALVEKEVLIFGGGYDERVDDAFDVSDALGNAVYIVDPDNGQLILSFSGECGSVDKCITVPDMDYPVPSAITMVDSNHDKRIDRLYFGDTGGQLWRIDLGQDIKNNRGIKDGQSRKTVVGKLADVGAGKRKFFNSPIVARVDDTKYAAQADYYYILIGSGDRANPLAATDYDRFYAFRDYRIGPMPDGDTSNPADHLADDYPKKDSNDRPAPITDDNMIDITEGSLAEQAGSNTNISDARGWYYDFKINGQKVLSDAVVKDTTLLFNSYIPPASLYASSCEASSIGESWTYGFDIISVSTARYRDAEGNIQHFDRVKGGYGGIGITPIFRVGDTNTVLSSNSANPGEEFILTGGPRQRTYWYQEF